MTLPLSSCAASLQAEYRPAAGALGSRFYPLTQDALLWFKQRGISQATLERNGIMMEDKYCAHVDKVVPQIAFPYLKNGSIVNVKYRALGVKAFTQSKGGEQILYGYDEAKVRVLACRAWVHMGHWSSAPHAVQHA